MKDKDLVNMLVARHVSAPVLLVADFDRGGVFASTIGTLELLDTEERALIKGFIINKFRGDLSLLTPGLKWLESRTGVPVMGVIPYFHDIQIAEEDSVSLERRSAMTAQKDYLIDIAVIGLPHISNIDEFDPLRGEPGVRLRYVEANDALGNPDLIILPGSKSTVADLEWLKVRGFAAGIRPLSEDGAAIVGICGGYQMLGSCILDPERVESDIEWSDGLGLLPVTTVFERGKRTDRVRGRLEKP